MGHPDGQWQEPDRPTDSSPPADSPYAPPASHQPGAQPPGSYPPASYPPGPQPASYPHGSQPTPSYQPPYPAAPYPGASHPGGSYPPGPPGSYPYPPQGPGAQPAAKSPSRLVAVLVTLGVLFVACAGFGAFGAYRVLSDNESAKPADSASRRPAVGLPTPDASSAPATTEPKLPAGVTGTVPKGSKSSTIKLRETRDLERVCEKWYYPKSPKYSTALSPHPIVISTRDRKDLDFRSTTGYLSVPYDSPAAIRAAWQPKTPGVVQLVACVDLVTTGAKVKSCKIDKPKPSSIAMKEGTYRLSLYEVATRRKIFDKRLTGEDETCPIFILIGNDRAVYTKVEDAQLVDALRPFVEE